MIHAILRHVYRAPSWLQVIYGVISAAIIVGPMVWLVTQLPKQPCKVAFAEGRWEAATQLCSAAYVLDGDQDEQVREAIAYLRLNNYPKAERRLLALLSSPHAAEAHINLTYIAQVEQNDSLARFHLEVARVLNAVEDNKSGLLIIEHTQSTMSLAANHYAEALAAADEGMRLAGELARPDALVSEFLARVDVLLRMGAMRDARQTLSMIHPLTECDKALVHLRRAESYMDDDETRQSASAELGLADLANHHCYTWATDSQIRLDRVELLWHTRPDVALSILNKFEVDNEGANFESQLFRAYIAARSGDLRRAEGYLTASDGFGARDVDWRWEKTRVLANLDELRGDSVAAERGYRQAMAMVTTFRTDSVSESGYILAMHRAAADDLISLLARQQRWRDVLEVVLQLDVSDMLHANDQQGLGPSGGGGLSHATVEDVLTAWRDRDLIVLLAPLPRNMGTDPDRAYRLRIRDGQLTGEDIGSASELHSAVARLYANPDRTDVAVQLTKQLIPMDGAPHPLYMLAVGALGKLQSAALRDGDGSLAIVRRSLPRIQSLLTTVPVTAAAGPAVVLADSKGNLGAADREGDMVKTALGADTIAYRASEVTRQHFMAGSSARLFHLAGHIFASGRDHVIPMIDGDISPRDVLRLHIAPRIAVLSTCDSGAADDEGWSSMSSAFLANGTEFVIATAYSVDDEAAAELMEQFYRQTDLLSDPAHALAVAQQTVIFRSVNGTSGKDLRSWVAFSVMARPPMAPLHR